MYTIKQPPQIIFGKFSVRDYIFPKQCLVITSKGSKSRDWLEYSNLKNAYLFENVDGYAKDVAACILILAESQYQSAFSVDKEINIMGMFYKLLQETK